MKLFLFTGFILLVVMALLLLTRTTARYKINVWLAFVYTTMACVLFYLLIFREHVWTVSPALRHSHLLFLYLSGACMRGYVALSSGREFIVRFKIWIYLLSVSPGIGYFVLGHYAGCKESFISFTASNIPVLRLAMLLAGSGFMVYNVVCCFRMTTAYKTNDTAKGDSMVTWHKILVAAFAVLSIILLLWSAETAFPTLITAVMHVLLCLLVLGLLLWQVHHPHLFFETGQHEHNHEKYASSTLSDHQLQVYAQRLKKLMDEEKYYLNPRLTRDELAEKVGILPHYLSQVLNTKINQSFNDFINQYRVIRAMELMAQPAKKYLSIEGIALESGFQNRVTFFYAFKNWTGVSPTEYRKDMVIKLS